MNKKQAYTLGFFFADGYLNPKQGRIAVEILKDDMDQLKHVFDSFLDWNRYDRQRTNDGVHRRPQSQIVKGNQILCNSMVSQGYHIPRDGTKALKHIPEKLHYMWFRGFFDGDGNIYHKNYQRQISVSGPKDMDWSFFLNQFPNFKTSKRSNASIYRICSLQNIVSFMSYLYPNCWDGIGLKRKWNTYCGIVNSN